MDYQVSARKYRPGSFEQVIGQPHIVQTLVNSIATKRIAHAFLFSGTRGVGKTTVARILAKALNCERGPTSTPCETCVNCLEIAQGSSVDVIENDGASNTGVDDVREIRENVKFTPFRGGYRVYIIDEVHMLSTSAFNALLKTLEEPPPHVVFVFATTEIHKIPATILSRCQHYNFRRIPRAEIIQRLRFVASEEGLTVEDRSLGVVAKASEGSLRDALSLLDQAVAFGGKTIRHADLEALLGAVPHELVRGLVTAVVGQDSPAAVRIVAQLVEQGHDARAYCAEVVEHLRNLLVAAVVSASSGRSGLRGLIDLSEEEIDRVVEEAKAFTVEQLQELFRIFAQAEDALRATLHPRFVLEVAAVRATRLTVSPASHGGAPLELPAKGMPGGAGSVPAKPRPTVPPPAAPAQSAAPPVPPSPANVRSMSGTSLHERTSGIAPARDAKPIPESPVRRPASTPVSATGRQDAAVRTAPEQSIAVDWERLLAQVEAQQPSLAPFLAAGMLLPSETGQVTIGVPRTSGVALARLQKEDSLKVLTDLCAELAGRPVRVRVQELADGKSAGASMAQIRAKKEQQRKQELFDRTRAHPVVKQALAVLGGELADVREVGPQKETS
jgi:DNA polymerase-3 subunit gamma/tau